MGSRNKEEKIDIDWTQSTAKPDPASGSGLEFSGQANRSRPSKSWRRSADDELTIGKIWVDTKSIADYVVRWRALVEALCTTKV